MEKDPETQFFALDSKSHHKKKVKTSKSKDDINFVHETSSIEMNLTKINEFFNYH
jgi:hypothetical protein